MITDIILIIWGGQKEFIRPLLQVSRNVCKPCQILKIVAANIFTIVLNLEGFSVKNKSVIFGFREDPPVFVDPK